MSKNQDLKVHAFNDVFFADNRLFTVLDKAGEEVSPVSVEEDSDLAWAMSRSRAGKMFDVPYADVSIVKIREEQEVVEYTPVDTSGRLKVLSVDEYDVLSDSFKAKYKKVLTEPVTVQEPVPVDVSFYDMDFDEDLFVGRTVRNKVHARVHLHALSKNRSSSGFWGSRDERSKRLIPGFGNFQDISLNAKSLFSLMRDTLREVGVASESNPVQVLLHIPDDDSSIYNEFRMEFLEKPYKGEMKDVLLKKSNGQPYADRRASRKQDLPETANKISFHASHMMEWWEHVDGNSLPDEEKLVVIRELVEHLLSGAQ